MPLYVVDSSVFNKLFLREEGREKALFLFQEASEENLTLMAPNLLYYEVIAASQHYGLPITPIIELLEEQASNNLTIIEPAKAHWDKAIEVIQIGHPKSGYPSIYDSIFHAIAIVENGTLITADRKHFVKTQQAGHIIMLNDFQSMLYS